MPSEYQIDFSKIVISPDIRLRGGNARVYKGWASTPAGEVNEITTQTIAVKESKNRDPAAGRELIHRVRIWIKASYRRCRSLLKAFSSVTIL
jgi:hypothetical protein